MKIFNIKEASDFLNISESTLYRSIKQNQIPARKVGKQWRLSEEALSKWLMGDNNMKDVIVPLTAKKTEKNEPNSLRFIDLFCGIGGFRQAAEKQGLKCVYSSDSDKFVQETYSHWYGEKPFGDITEFTASEEKLNTIPDFDILFAGFPCQPFSYAGRNEGFEDKTRGTLFFHVAKILSHHKPQALVLENVKGLKSHNKGATIQVIRDTLSELGYTLFDDIINSYHFGVPQYRERWFCVGIRNDLIKTDISEFSLNKGNLNLQPKLLDIIDDSVEINKSNKIADFELERIDFHFKNMNFFEDKRVQHDNSKYAPDTKKGRFGVYSYLKPDKTLRFHIGDRAKTQIQEAYYVHSNTYAPAIIANRRPKLWDLKRYLTVKECLKLQAFPSDLEFPVSDAQAFKQLGNSVCVKVVESVVSDMLQFLRIAQSTESSLLKKTG
ncbi:DNA (cytosine-5-)-methyltransferase [Thalassotalea litorea]|uniref:Cytosine-specific methyltransferase n=1 Tax=Thalassotalea litorea TaxID=2020715 RepID=A0A5R9IPZ8_9GAMM|nr:DNA (cytosine-5-)-methyltransferase [Thalassotalea litorea]TLU65296.1 DNA (cytosine-5-)-methyltransferase [Thalassotalea litorea]